LALSFTLLFYVTNMVREREHGQKQLLAMAGLESRAYYLAAFIRDYLIYLLPTSVFLIMMKARSTPMFVESSPVGYVLLLFLAGPPSILLGYLLSFAFSKSQSVALAIGFILLMIVFVPFVIIHYVFSDRIDLSTIGALSFFLPTFALQRGLTELALGWSKGFPYSASMVFNIRNPILPTLLALVASTAFYGILVTCLEYTVSARVSPLKSTRRLYNRKRHVSTDGPETKVDIKSDYSDEEVINEKRRILENREDTDAMRIQGLTKEFLVPYSNRRRLVIDDLWLSLRRNECLGYLGPNGAGKTTTIKMLIGAVSPTSGNATVEGHPIVPYSAELRQLVGVCQQFDILFSELTGREHLRLFARLRGAANIEEAVETTINDMRLQEVADQKSKGYSGGNKRRLSIGMAAIGHPKVVFLDEPTTGVDVHIRQSIWNAIRELKKKTSVVLITHSMEEADALCDRIGLTVNGQLAALGTPQRLKNVYGRGYKINVRTATTDTVESVIQQIFQRFTMKYEQIKLIRRLGCNLEFEVEGSTVGKIFQVLQELRSPLNIIDHAVAQTTLAQVFVEFAKQQRLDL
ncbi:P-loop containing nucleoside triphosphate hydrolase protein, partial [Basidiobolus meristosporus CBS 931.73]